MNEQPTQKLCECGCGKPTKLNRRTRGSAKKGEPQRWIRGHWSTRRRLTLEPPNPSGLCQCGCGLPAPIATLTNTRHGHMRGLPLRYIIGHQAQSASRRRLIDQPHRWRVEDKGFVSACWLWCGRLENGYGRFRTRGSNQFAHRAMYEQEMLCSFNAAILGAYRVPYPLPFPPINVQPPG